MSFLKPIHIRFSTRKKQSYSTDRERSEATLPSSIKERKIAFYLNKLPNIVKTSKKQNAARATLIFATIGEKVKE